MAGFGGMAFVGDLAKGFQDTSSSIRQQNTREAEIQAARDEKVFDALANSEDPDVRAAAVTGLLTGNHPAGAFNKWFGKVGTHPAFEQIKGLVSSGHQPFMGTEDTAAAKTAGSEKGRVTGAVKAYQENTGEQPSPDFVERVIQGSMNVRQPMPQRASGEVLNDSTGQWEPWQGSYINGKYFDQEMNQEDRQVRNVRHDAAAPRSGAAGAKPTYKKMSVADYKAAYGDHALLAGHQPTDIVDVPLDPTGKVAGPPTFPPPTATSSFTPVLTPSGIFSFNTKKGTAAPTGGGAGVQHPEPPTASADYLMRIHGQIRQQAKDELQKSVSGIQPKGADIKKKEDEIAVRHGFKSIEDLEQQISAAGGRIDAATPGGGAGAGAPPAAPKGAAPAAAPKAKPALDPIVQGVLDQLNLGTKKKPGG